jgi:hypothetical protein
MICPPDNRRILERPGNERERNGKNRRNFGTALEFLLRKRGQY